MSVFAAANFQFAGWIGKLENLPPHFLATSSNRSLYFSHKQRPQRRRQMSRPYRPICLVVPPMGAHAAQDAMGQCKGIAAVFAADARRFACLHALHEMLQFASKLIALVAIQF
jgi:hypothetical protein